MAVVVPLRRDTKRFGSNAPAMYLTGNLFDHLDQLSEALPGRRDLAVSINEEVPMFRIHAPILIVVPTAEASPPTARLPWQRSALRLRIFSSSSGA
jgi:hypothetical protein